MFRKISGSIKEIDGIIQGNISSIVPKIEGNIQTSLQSLVGEIIPTTEIPIYDGVTEVIPNQLDQILETRRRLMVENIEVKGVPYAEVGNPSGGLTVTIGE